MRRVAIYFVSLLFSCLLFLQGPAQKKSILYRPFHSRLSKATIREYLDEINAHSGVLVEFASGSFRADKQVSPGDETVTLGALLQQVLAGEKVKAIEKNDKILLVPSTVALPEDALLPVYSFYGIVSEEGSLEPLSEASVSEPSAHKGTISNVHGYFSLSLPEGRHLLEVTYAGYRSKTIVVNLHWDYRADVSLSPREDIPEVIISSGNGVRKDNRIVAGQYDAYNNFLGENDALRTLYLLPGVMNVTDASNGLLVRGGEQDGNLFLLDGNPVFNPTHMLGALSIVNKTSMRSMQLFKSDFPSKYGGRLSSVIDVYTKDGNMHQWEGEANVNFLAGSFTVEGPLKKDRTAMMISFRHSMPNALLNLFQKDFDNDFYDVHFKLTHLLNRNNKLMASFYTGQDDLGLQVSDNNLNNRQRWGNRVASVGWTHLLGSNSFVNTSVNYSDYYNLAGYIYTVYDDSTGVPVSRRSFNTYSSIAHYTAKTQFEVRASNSIKLNFGGEAAFTRIKPFESRIDSTITVDPTAFESFTPLPFREYTLYTGAEINLGRHILIRPGVHFSAYHFRGFHYISCQPRLFAAYQLNEREQVYFSFDRMTQYLHLLTNPSLGINSDTWVPSTGLLSPEESRSVDIGYSFRNGKKFSLTTGVYWKQMDNVTNYAEGKSFFINTDSSWEQNVETGKGWSYGWEFMVEKTSRKLNMHIAYTLSWNWRQFALINQGRQFPFKYDRRHNLNIAMTYKADKTKDISLLWMIASGDVFTLPERIYPDYDNARQIYNPDDVLRNYRFIYHFSGVNDYRTQPYHRLDLSASYHPVRKRRFGFNWTAGIYNVYGSPSQYSYGLEGTLNGKSIVIVMKNKLFNVTPYLSSTIDF
jgi:hypothetical protein